MDEVFGTFILRLEDQTYTGEFFNNHANGFIQEVINVVQANTPFVGTFNTNWQEGTSLFTSDLMIVQNRNNIFNLIWTNVQIDGVPANVIYVGRGVLRDNILTSVYTKVEA
ncbi:MAG: hypothetical protein ACTHJN_08880 [Ginsengibacter sp.]